MILQRPPNGLVDVPIRKRVAVIEAKRRIPSEDKSLTTTHELSDPFREIDGLDLFELGPATTHHRVLFGRRIDTNGGP